MICEPELPSTVLFGFVEFGSPDQVPLLRFELGDVTTPHSFCATDVLIQAYNTQATLKVVIYSYLPYYKMCGFFNSETAEKT